MSAYICDPENIKRLAIFGARHRVGADDNAQVHDLATRIADALYQENIRSVQSRYPQDTWENLPGPCEKPRALVVSIRDFERLRRLTPIEALKGCDSLEYQSCETDDYYQTPAWLRLQGIRKAAIHALPGYEDAPWFA